MIIIKIILAVLILNSSTALNLNPVIGIFTQPSSYDQFPPQQYSYIFASYVKFIESAGAQVIAIPHDADKATLDDIFSKINGILFPGGDAELDINYIQPGSQYPYNILTYNANYLLNKAITANKLGDYFPIWGTCMGFQLLHLLVNNYTDPLQAVANEVYFTRNITYDKVSSRLYDSQKSNVKDYAEKVGSAFYNHHWAIFDDVYTKYPKIASFFKRTAHSFNGINQTFVASVEAYDYPIYGVQYHPEKNQFEWLLSPNRDPTAIKWSQSISNFFVNEARQNIHTRDQTWLNQRLIYNYNPYNNISTSTNQVYIIPNIENGNKIQNFKLTEFLEEISDNQYHD